MPPSLMQRIIIVGTSCSGKSTLARKLAAKLDIQHIELDELFWLPKWEKRPPDEFRALVQNAIASVQWVACGNFSGVRDILWPRATHVIWLNYPFRTVMGRGLYRTIGRAFKREELFSGNYESFRHSFLSLDSILWWVLKTYRSNRRRYRQLRDQQAYPHLTWSELRHPRDAERLIENLEQR